MDDILSQLEAHQLWLNDSTKGQQLVLNGVDLSKLALEKSLRLWDFSRSCLKNVRFSGSDLNGICFAEADLTGATFKNVDLCNANLCHAKMELVQFTNVSFSYANLSYVNLNYSILNNTSLHMTNLRNADLSNVTLRNADLYTTDLSFSNLKGAILENTKLGKHTILTGVQLPDFPVNFPEGDFIAWKKVRPNNVLKLLITGERTSCLTNRSCRASKALVLEADSDEKIFSSIYFPDFKYTVGKEVSVVNYSSDIRISDAPGIHFFMTQQEAQAFWV